MPLPDPEPEKQASPVSVISEPGVFVATSIGTTLRPDLTTYAVRPSGVTATAVGFAPTRIGVPGVFVASAIGVTVALPWLATYAVVPSGVMAIPSGAEPTWIGVPTVAVAS